RRAAARPQSGRLLCAGGLGARPPDLFPRPVRLRIGGAEDPRRRPTGEAGAAARAGRVVLAPEPGTEIDGFTLGERIHVGTMAWIYRLTGPAGALPLIMKIPRLGAGERAANVISFEVCRMVLGALSQSPHHPTLIAYGDVETTPYLVMEHIEGTRLDEWLR